MSKSLLRLQLQNRERDFRNESWFRTCSIFINLVTSLEGNPIRYATTLYHFGQTRNGSPATLFILLSSNATSSARGDYVAVPEGFVQNDEPASRNEERTGTKIYFAPKIYPNDAQWNRVFS